ncbi:MAG: Veg family protein [Clostridia bacterium]
MADFEGFAVSVVFLFKTTNFGNKLKQGGMMKRNENSLVKVKAEISALKGASVNLSVNRGRCKIEQLFGKVESVYPSVFTINVVEGKNAGFQTFSYCDVLCGDVKITAN